MNLRKDHSHASDAMVICVRAMLSCDVVTFYIFFGAAGTVPHITESTCLTVVNVLARAVMKNVANCDIQYELRRFGSYEIFERMRHSGVITSLQFYRRLFLCFALVLEYSNANGLHAR